MFFVHVLSIKGEDLYCRKYCWCCKWSLDFTYSAVKLLLESGSFTLFNLYMLSTRCRMRKFVMCIITEPFELFELYVHDSYITSFQSFSINIFYQKFSFNVLSLIPNLQDRLFSSWKKYMYFHGKFWIRRQPNNAQLINRFIKNKIKLRCWHERESWFQCI